MNELETLIPQPVEIKIGGETMEIKPLTIGQITRVMKALKPALADHPGNRPGQPRGLRRLGIPGQQGLHRRRTGGRAVE